MRYDAVIVTAMSPTLGGGHFQRMASLLWRLRERFGLKAAMLLEGRSRSVPAEIRDLLIDSIEGSPRLIIRDMRDSTEEEIDLLRKYAPVCVIDDLGRGRETADFCINILPVPENVKICRGEESGFIYGYDFVRSLLAIGSSIIDRDTDFAVYPGFMSDAELPPVFNSLLPAGASLYVLNGNDSIRKGKDGQMKASGKSIAAMLLSSRVLITHFGLMLYEAALTGCGLITLNPTEYHSALAEQAKKKLALINLGVSGNIDVIKAADEIKKRLESSFPAAMRGKDAAEAAIAGIDEIVLRIKDMLC
jgi:hypothetical protein